MGAIRIVIDSEIEDFKITSCGRLKVHLQDNNLEVVSNRIVAGGGTIAHYHKLETQIYLIVAGAGLIKLRDRETGAMETKAVGPLCTILIPPNHVHQLVNTGGEELIHYEICRPVWSPDDEFFEDF